MPPGRGMELELETGDSRMPRSGPVKRLSDGELAELRAQNIDLLYRGRIQHSTAGYAASVDSARKPDGSWRTCYDYRSLNAINAINAIRSSRCRTSTRCSTARGGHTLSPRSIWPAVISSCGCGRGPVEDERSVAAGPVRVERGAFWSAGGLLAADAGHEPGPHRGSPLPGTRTRWSGPRRTATGPTADTRRGRGASGPLGRCALVYMDDCLVHSPTPEQHLLDVAEVLEILRRR